MTRVMRQPERIEKRARAQAEPIRWLRRPHTQGDQITFA